MKIGVTITGADDVRSMLMALGTEGGTQALAMTAEDVEEFVGNEAGQHTRTGALFRSVTKRRDGSAWEVLHDRQAAPHALFVHWGTKPHTIRAKGANGGPGKKALRWPGGAGFVFARQVRHPGNKADPWMLRAADQAPQMFARHVAALLGAVNRRR